MFIRYLLPLLFAIFPLEVVSKLLVVTLRRLSRKTETTYDDELVRILEKHFKVEPEVKDEHSGRH